MNKKISALLIILLMSSLIGLLNVQTGHSQGMVASQFQVVVDHAAHLKYGLYYPVTYRFVIPGGSSGLSAQVRYSTSEAWTTLPTMTTADFFNGINAARFDYPNNLAYVSAAFSNYSDVIYIRLLNGQTETAISYSGIPLYYDNRRAAVTVTLDDWDSRSSNWDTASRILTSARVHFTVGIMSGFNPDWSLIQYWYNQGYLEPGSHTRNHPCTDSDYQRLNGYDYQITGQRDDILSNLNLAHPYVPAFISPCGFESPQVRQAVVNAGHIADRGANSGTYGFTPWAGDGAYQTGLYSSSTFTWGGVANAARRDEANASFDSTYAAWGIYHFADHPNDGYLTDGSYVAQHIDYISNRPDVWYAAFGELYLYHYVQERGMVSVSPIGDPLPTFTPTPTQPSSSEVINPEDLASLPAGTNVLLNFNNFPNPNDGQPVPAGYAGSTWTSLVEGSPWAGIPTWNFYISSGSTQGTIIFPRPVIVNSLRVSSGQNNNVVTLSSSLNSDASITLAANTPQTLVTGWTNAITSLVIRSSTSDHVFDDLRLTALGGSQGPTPTLLPLPTHTFTPTQPFTPTNPADTQTVTVTVTETPLPSLTPTFTNTPTEISEPLQTNTPTQTNTPVQADTPTQTNTATQTDTPTQVVIPTETNTPTPTGTPSPTPTATFTHTQQPDLIFASGFETGTLAEWSSSATDLGDISASPSAALTGSYGLQVVVDNNTAIYVRDDTPSAERQYRARFYFDPNSIGMANGNAHYIFYGYSGASTVVTRVELRYSSGVYQLRTALVNDSTSWRTSAWFSISDAPHFIELAWRSSTAVGANNGSLTFWIDGVQQANLTAVDNDTRRIDSILLGPAAGIDKGTRGTYFIDAFESRRLAYIGE